MNKRWIGSFAVAVGVLTVIAPFIVGYNLDELRVNPLFWLRFEFSPDFKKTVALERSGTNQASVTFSFTKGNSGVFADVDLFTGTNRIARLGGNENTFLGFRDVDKDGSRELLFTSTSKYSSGRSVWKFEDGRWTELSLSPSALRTLRLAELLFYGPAIVFVGILVGMIGLLLIVTRGTQVQPKAV